MTPAARVAAAIEILDEVLGGAPAERALTRWARTRRFAGSKDRAAIRDHVFDALRNLRSYAWAGGQPWPDTTGRAVMLGALRQSGTVPGSVFTAQGYAPSELTAEEARPAPPMPEAEAWNMPDAVAALLRESIGAQAFDAACLLGTRAPVTLRVNLARLPRGDAAEQLRAEGIGTAPNPLSPAALTVTEGARQVQRSAAFGEGLVELQDASSQAVVDSLPLSEGQSVLDFCAGGGGKSLALAMHLGGPVWAYDADAARMADIPARAARAGADLRVCESLTAMPSPFDLVLVDAPCSGSGAWRRAPDAKWRFTGARLAELTGMQDAVLEAAAEHVGPGGCLAYATCSVLRAENDDRVAAFLGRRSGWRLDARRHWPIGRDGDGFFCALLTRE